MCIRDSMFGSIPKMSGLRSTSPVRVPSAEYSSAVSRSATLLHRLSHNHDRSLGAGNGTLEQQDIALVVDLDDIEVQHGRLVTAHASRHSLALEHTSGCGAGAAVS